MNELVKQGKYYSGCGLHEEAYRYFLEAAMKDEDTDAYFWLGRMYLYGWHVRKDYEKAFKYFKDGYDVDGPNYFLADIMEERKEIAKDKRGRELFIDLLEYMLECGEKNTLISIGLEYGSGDIYPLNYEKQRACYQKAIDCGINMGYECMGEVYFKGEGVEQDYKKAYEYFMKYDEFCSFLKPFCIAEMYRNGWYLEKNMEKAIELYKEIVESEGSYKTEDMYYLKSCEILEELGIPVPEDED